MGQGCHSKGDLEDDAPGSVEHGQDDMVAELNLKLKAMEEQVSSLQETLQQEKASKKELREMMSDLDDNFVIIGRRDALEDPCKGMELAPDAELTVLLFGMTGCGKSSLGNLIIGERVFLASDDTSSVTRLDSLLKYEAEDGSLTLLDTIGLGDTELTQEQVAQSIRDVALQAPRGVDVLLFVMKNERLTDDAIARFIYITQFWWGDTCLPNLYIAVTHASRYATDRKEAVDWIRRNIQINWRFKHIFETVGSDPSRFIFIDNPDVYSMEPKIPERHRASRRSVMNVLALHNRAVTPPFTNAMMTRAMEMSKGLSESMEAMKKKETEIAELKKKLDLVRTGECDEADPERLEALKREADELEKELGKARLQKIEQKKKDLAALTVMARSDQAFNDEVKKEVESSTGRFRMKFAPAVGNAKKAVNEGVAKGASASAAVVEDLSKACWRLASSFKMPMMKGKAKAKAEAKKDELAEGTWLPKDLFEQAKNVDPKMREHLMDNAKKDMELHEETKKTKKH